MSTTRRNFIKGLGLGSLWFTQSDLLQLGAHAAGIKRRIGQKILVVVQLSGGNDGLNTVVPYGLGSYYDARPTISIKPHEVIALNSEIGLHPDIPELARFFKQQKLAIIQSVGYPDASRSHFRSVEIWQTAYPHEVATTGWLGRYLDQLSLSTDSKKILSAINVDPLMPKTLQANRVATPSLSGEQLSLPHFDLTAFEAQKSSVNYPDFEFARGLKSIARLITGGITSRIYTISLNGFDTHANQSRTHSELLKQLSSGLGAFQLDLENAGVADDVLVLVFSEFGRRLHENDAGGTDHGTAQPLLVIGSSVNGALYGNQASLTDLRHGDLKHSMDFRCVYATILDNWLQADSRQILGGSFETVPFV